MNAQTTSFQAFKDQLITIAKCSIQSGFTHNYYDYRHADNLPKELLRKAASFSSIYIDGELNGCIGSLLAHQELAEDVSHNSFQAAFHDHRFPAVHNSQFDQLSVSLSILSDLKPVNNTSEQQFLDSLQPGIDGVMIEFNQHRATFLPHVWASLPDPSDFLGNLKQKAGLDYNFWHQNMTLKIYTVETLTSG